MVRKKEKLSLILIIFMLCLLGCNAMYGIVKNNAAAAGVRDAYIDMQMDSAGQ